MVAKEKKSITFDELAAHNTRDDCWICIDEKVYDVSKWMERHPGGYVAIMSIAGTDATDVFKAFHKVEVNKLLPAFHVANISEPLPIPKHLAEYRELRTKLEEAGFFRTDYTFYYKLVAAMAVVFASVIGGVVFTSSAAVHMLCAAALGWFWNQCSYIGHDTGHNAITRTRKWDSWIGLLTGNILTGIGIQWWKRTHNVHHVVPNSLEWDPDVQHVPVFTLSPAFFGSLFSKYHMRTMEFDGVARFLVRYQHFLYYPVMAVARLNMYAQTIGLLCTKQRCIGRVQEVVGELVYVFWYSLLLSLLPSSERLPFFLLSHMMTGILHVQVCLNHFPMPMFSGKAENNSFVVRQLAGSMDIECPTWMDWFHGGLQFQVEHHLFPRVARHRLRELVPMVKDLATRNGLPYNSANFVQANMMVVDTLRKASQAARTKEDLGMEDFKKSLIWDGMNMIG